MKRLLILFCLSFVFIMAAAPVMAQQLDPAVLQDSIPQDDLGKYIDKILEDGIVTFTEFLGLFDGLYMLIVGVIGIAVRFFPAVKKIPAFVYVALAIAASVGLVWSALGLASLWQLVLSAGFAGWLFDILKPILKKVPIIGPILGGTSKQKPQAA